MDNNNLPKNRKEQFSVEDYKFIAENTLDAIWLLGLDLRFKYITPSVEDMFGYTQQEFIGKHLSEIAGEKEFETMKTQVIRAIEHKDSFKHTLFEVNLRHKDGHEVPSEILGRLLKDENGNVKMMHGVTRDITERKEYEKRIKTSEAMFRMISDYAYDVEVFIDKEGLIQYVNPALMRLTGKDPSRYLQKSFENFDIFKPGEQEKAGIHIADLLNGGILNDSEFDVIDSSGKELRVSISGQAVRDASGNILGARVSLRDMSVRKKADLIRTTLLGDIAHSINTPLGTINSALQLLHMYMEKGDMKKMHSYHEIIEKNVFSIAENVSNLLTIYSLNKEDIKGMKEKVSIRNVLKSVIFSLEQNIEYKHINMHVDIPKEADEVFFIEKQLYSLLWNTVHNGVKYTENGDIFVTGRLHGKKICIGIRDTGKGIRKEDMGKIFQMFFSTGESAGGVGIGLNICRSIVDMYGGRINVSSEGPGKGTSINIVIPQ